MLGWITAAVIAFVLFVLWCMCKAAADADKAMEAAMAAKRRSDTNESGEEVSSTDTKV